ncbi:MAG: hypothetical protein H7066_23340, partial [Cytophagaceae bacterium]|nr:hypothetical protein [Gemmatimonadaceae bacterium]
NEDEAWDGVWDVATRIDSVGWTAEFRIPFSQLRYANKQVHVFGFGVWRDIERYKERTSWPLYRPAQSGISSQLGTLHGIRDITPFRRLEITPYTVAKNSSIARTGATAGSPAWGRTQKMSAGADLKYGVTPNLTLDATVNPDFGQVEADPAVVNLSAFEVFFNERRPFFLEGTALYSFALNCYIVVDCGTNEGLFYSRRIGRSPALRDLYGNSTTPTSTSIAAATKLTGRTNSGLSFGLLDAVTQRVTGDPGKTVEPTTNFAVFRVQQDLRGGEAGIGVIATAVNRSLDSWTEPYLHRNAYATGATFRNRFYKSQYEFSAQFTGSRLEGSPEVLARTQRNSVHFYQQPGDEVDVDTTRTSLMGHAEQVKFGKYGGGITRFETSLVRQSAGFDVNDIGFLQRADQLNWSTWSALTFRNARGIYRWAQVNANHWETWTTSGTRLDNSFNVNGHMGLVNNWDVHLGGTMSRVTPSFCDRCTRGGPLLRQSRGFFPWGGVNTDSRRTVSGGLWFNLGFTDEGNTKSRSLEPYVNLRVSTRLQANVGTRFAKNVNDMQWFGNFADAQGGQHYSFAHLDQKTVSTNIRLNYTATPRLSFEFYGQPFVTKGTYSDVREVSATPDADAYDDRFQPYTAPAGSATSFTVTQLRTNAVARWEYRPGSTLFVVWAHGRQDQDDQYDGRSWTRDYRELFGLHPNNTFLVKFAYWINR